MTVPIGETDREINYDLERNYCDIGWIIRPTQLQEKVLSKQHLFQFSETELVIFGNTCLDFGKACFFVGALELVQNISVSSYLQTTINLVKT